MTIREAGKGIVTNRKRICSYRIGFINSDGREDETELDVCNLAELEEVYQDFLKRMASGRIL